MQESHPPHPLAFSWIFKLMELGRVELPSALGIYFPLVHRFSPANPWDGRDSLSRIAGCFGDVLATQSTKGG
jgi:hypothetical protein